MVWCDLRSIDAAACIPSRVLAAAFVTVRAARPTRGAAHQNHHRRSFAPAAIRSSVATMYHDPITEYWSVSSYRTRRTALAVLLLASNKENAVVAGTRQTCARW